MKGAICIAGKNDIAVEVVNFIRRQYMDYEILALCNACDDGLDSFQRSYKKFVHDNGIREITLEEAQEIRDLIFISTEYDRIIKPGNFSSTALYNVHFSLLPKYKGMHICLFHILNGEYEGGVTFHKIDAGIDTGEIIKQIRFDIEEHDSARDLYLKLIKAGTELAKECIATVLEGDYYSYPQDSVHSTYNSKDAFSYKDFVIDLNQTAWMISRQVKALCFREFQLPIICGNKIFEYEISDRKTGKKAGTIISETELEIRMSTIDYDIILYKDMLNQIVEFIKQDDEKSLKRIPRLPFYRNEHYKNRTLLDLAEEKNAKKCKAVLHTAFM